MKQTSSILKFLAVAPLAASSLLIGSANSAQAGIFFNPGDRIAGGGDGVVLGSKDKDGNGDPGNDFVDVFWCDAPVTGTPINIGNPTASNCADIGNTAGFDISGLAANVTGGFKPLLNNTDATIRSFDTDPNSNAGPPLGTLLDFINGTGTFMNAGITASYDFDLDVSSLVDVPSPGNFFLFQGMGTVTRTDSNGLTDTAPFLLEFSSQNLVFGPNQGTSVGEYPEATAIETYSLTITNKAVEVPEPSSVLGLAAIGSLAAFGALKRKGKK